MYYTLTSFCGVTLPAWSGKYEGGAGPSHSLMTEAISGTYHDGYGTARAPVKYPYTLPYSAVILGQARPNDTPATTDLQQLQIDVRAIQGLRGQRGYLLRTDEGGLIQWCTARATRVNVPQDRQQETMIWQPIGIEFQILTPWFYIPNNGTPSVPALITVTGSGTQYLVNAGTATVTNAIITFASGSNPGIAVTYADGTASSWTFTGTASTLVINCGAWSVINGGVDAYISLTLGPAHMTRTWLPIPPNLGTALPFTITGTAAIQYAYGYE